MEDILFSIGFELEFYIDSPNEDIHNIINNDKISIKKEKGFNQYEIITIHSIKIDEIILLLENTKKKLYDLYKEKNNCLPIFTPKPFLNRTGSSLQLNISLHNKLGMPIFKNKECQYLIHSMGGLYHNLKNYINDFLPDHESRKRIMHGDNHTPKKISWGYNNRTVAINVKTLKNKYIIEHRVPSNNCNITKVIKIITNNILDGINNKLIPPDPIYGNAFDRKYNLISIL